LTAAVSNFADIDRQADGRLEEDVIVSKIPLAPRLGEKTFQPHDTNGSRERWRKLACEPEKKHEERVHDEKSDGHGSRRPWNGTPLGDPPPRAASLRLGKSDKHPQFPFVVIRNETWTK
jgi:hypothetical protein